jgi:MFS family permease
MFFGLFTPLVFLSNYGKSQHYSSEKSAFLLSILAFVDMVARPSMGLVANTKWIRPRIQYFFAASVVANGVCHLLAPLSTSYVGFCIYSGFFGFAFGWLSSVLFETLMDLVGPQRFSSAVGLVTIVECCPVLLGPPLLGKVCLPTPFSLYVCHHKMDKHDGNSDRMQRLVSLISVPLVPVHVFTKWDSRGWDVARWYRACLACARPSVRSQHQKREDQKKKWDSIKLKLYGGASDYIYIFF